MGNTPSPSSALSRHPCTLKAEKVAHARLLHTPPVRAGRPEGGARAGVCSLPHHRAGTGARPTRHVCAHAQGRSAGLGTHGICPPLPHLPPYFPVPSAPVLARAGQQRLPGRRGWEASPTLQYGPAVGASPLGDFSATPGCHRALSSRPGWLPLHPRGSGSQRQVSP